MKGKAGYIVIGLAVSWGVLAYLRSHRSTLIERPTNASVDSSIYHYHTINASDSSGDLIGYVLHEKKSDDNSYLECSAIVRELNPEKDDYKALCKDVIDDIVAGARTRKIVVNIYDNDSAYQIFEINAIQNYGMVDTNDMKLYGKHFVAAYESYMYDEDDNDANSITFYQYGKDKYDETEHYVPKTLCKEQ